MRGHGGGGAGSVSRIPESAKPIVSSLCSVGAHAGGAPARPGNSRRRSLRQARRSLLLDRAYGADLVYGANVPGAAAQVVRVLAASTARAEPRIPETAVTREDFDLIRDQLGDGYGASTPAARHAMATAAESGLQLDSTYSGKCLAAVLERARHGPSTSTLSPDASANSWVWVPGHSGADPGMLGNGGP